MPAIKQKMTVAAEGTRKWVAQKLKYNRMSKSCVSSDINTVILSGVQRSGTNMFMDVFDKSYETVVYNETNIKAFNNYEMRDYEIIESLRDRSSAPNFVIKALCELHDLNKLLDILSPAKSIWMFRDYNDVVNSMLVSFGNQALQINRFVGNGGSDEWLSRGMSDSTIEILRRFSGEHLDDASAAALQWYMRNVLLFEQNLHTDLRVKVISYDHLVVEPQIKFVEIFEFLGLEYTERLSASVNARSIRRRETPVIDSEIRAICDGLYQRLIENMS